jgi:hypothetical protein
LFPLGGNPMFKHLYGLTTGTTNLAKGHGTLRYLA